MKQFLLILATLVLIAIGLVLFARRGHVAPLVSSTDVIRADDGVLYVIEYLDQRIVVLLPKEWNNVTSRTTAISQTKALDADVDLYASDGGPRVNIQFHSSDPGTLRIDNRPFYLANGGVFLVTDEVDSSGAKKVVQAPFHPLEGTREYLTTLREELEK